jgi:hypothetical protein
MKSTRSASLITSFSFVNKVVETLKMHIKSQKNHKIENQVNLECS